MAEATPGGRRSHYGTAVATGLLTAGLTSVAAGKPWFHATVDYKLAPGVRESDRAADMPLALALSLVVLAGWGVLLVTRGRIRRVVAGVALLAGVGVVACVALAPFILPDQVRGQLLGGSTDAAVSPTGWYLTAAIAAVLAVPVLVLACLRSPVWPTMSSRYDAPGSDVAEIRTDTDLWKALDEGHDPTDPIDRRGPTSP